MSPIKDVTGTAFIVAEFRARENEEPHPLYVERAAGSRKWDVDGNEYVDHLGGHGALILGHGYPAVVEAVSYTHLTLPTTPYV